MIVQRSKCIWNVKAMMVRVKVLVEKAGLVKGAMQNILPCVHYEADERRWSASALYSRPICATHNAQRNCSEGMPHQ